MDTSMWDDIPLPKKSECFFNKPYIKNGKDKIVTATFTTDIVHDGMPTTSIMVELESGIKNILVQYGTCDLGFELSDIVGVGFDVAQNFISNKWLMNNRLKKGFVPTIFKDIVVIDTIDKPQKGSGFVYTRKTIDEIIDKINKVPLLGSLVGLINTDQNNGLENIIKFIERSSIPNSYVGFTAHKFKVLNDQLVCDIHVDDMEQGKAIRGFIDNDKFKFILWSKSFKSIMRNGGEYPDVKEYTLIEMPDPICVIFTPKVH